MWQGRETRVLRLLPWGPFFLRRPSQMGENGSVIISLGFFKETRAGYRSRGTVVVDDELAWVIRRAHHPRLFRFRRGDLDQTLWTARGAVSHGCCSDPRFATRVVDSPDRRLSFRRRLRR